MPKRRPRQDRPPSPPRSAAKLVLRSAVPPGSSAVPARVARCFSESPAKLFLRVPKRRPPGSPAKLVLRLSAVCRPPYPSGSSAVPAKVARQALFASGKAPSPLGSSAVPARVARQARFTSASQGRPPSSLCECQTRQGRPPSPPGSPTKLFLRVRKRRVSPGWSAVPVRVVRRPRQGRPPSFASAKAPSPPGRLVLRVSGVCRPPSSPGSSALARQALFASAKAPSPPQSSAVLRPQGRPPSPPGSPAKLVLRVSGVCLPPSQCRPFRQGRPPSSFCEGQSAVPARVVRRPRQGRPPSPPGSPAKLFLRVPKRRPRHAAKLVLRVSGVCRPPSPSGSSAIPAKVARQALFASATVPSPSGSSAVPARVARQAEPASVSPPGSSAGPTRVARQAL